MDAHGNPTTDPNNAKSLLFFGQHKGYGLALVNELLAGFTGSGIPYLRGKWNEGPADEKHTPHFFFQCIRADALDCGNFPAGRDQKSNVKAVIKDILGHGNDKVLLPGQLEAQAAAHKMLAEARSKLDAALTAERARLEISATTLGREIAEKALGRRLAS